VDVAVSLDAGIAPPPVRVDHAAGGDGIQDERVQTFRRSIRDQTKADSPDAPAILLRSHYNQIALVNFNLARQKIAPRPHHRAPQFVQPSPGGLVLLQAQHTLQYKR
jgi:hypothetical protein